MRPHSLESPWEGDIVFDVENIERSISEQQQVLKDRLRKIKSEKGDTISTYLNKLTTCRDELGSVGITTADDDMVSLALLGIPKSQYSYQDSVNGRKKLPGLGTALVGFDAGGDKKKHPRWFFIQGG